jgi:hypothetical protein
MEHSFLERFKNPALAGTGTPTSLALKTKNRTQWLLVHSCTIEYDFDCWRHLPE